MMDTQRLLDLVTQIENAYPVPTFPASSPTADAFQELRAGLRAASDDLLRWQSGQKHLIAERDRVTALLAQAVNERNAAREAVDRIEQAHAGAVEITPDQHRELMEWRAYAATRRDQQRAKGKCRKALKRLRKLGIL